MSRIGQLALSRFYELFVFVMVQRKISYGIILGFNAAESDI